MKNEKELKKIFFYIPHLYIGGVSKVFLNLINKISNLNIRIFIAVGDSDEETESKLRAINGITVINLNKRKASKSLIAVTVLIKKVNPDIAIGVQSHAAWILSAAAILSLYSGKIISWEHTTPSIASKSYNLLKRNLHRTISIITSLRINSYICVSNGVASDIQNFLKLKNWKIKKICSPIFDEKNIRERINTPIKKNCVNFLTVGRLSAEKGLIDLLSAVNFLPKNESWHLTIVGSGPEESNLKKFVKDKNLTEYVFFSGHQSSVENWYLSSDFFVLTSHYEGLPTVLIEASQYGLPIVSTDCESGPREIILDKKNGLLVPVGDIHSITIALKEMIQNHKNYKNNYKFIAEYESKNSANEFIQHFKSVFLR